MAYVDFKRGYVRFKLVYYGPENSGKTSNLEYLTKINSEQGEIVHLGADDPSTGQFEHLPLNLGSIRSIDTMLKMYTVPGGEQFNKTRQMVLKDVDGVVFVADSSEERLDANIACLQTLEENLARRNISLLDLPVLIQYNKRDLKDALPIETLEDNLNPYTWPQIASSVTEGKGIKEALTTITQLIYEQTASKYTLVPSMAPTIVMAEESEPPEPILEEPEEPPPLEEIPSQLERAQAESHPEIEEPSLELEEIEAAPEADATPTDLPKPPPLPKPFKPEEELQQESDLELLELSEDDSEKAPKKARKVPLPPGKLSRNLAAHLIKSVPPPPALRNSVEPGPVLPTPTQPTSGDLESLLEGLETRLLKRMDLLEVCMQHLDKKHDKLTEELQKGRPSTNE